VFLSGKDVSLLVAALNMGYNDFRDTFCRWIPSENGTEKLSLKEKSNYDCVFWGPEPAVEDRQGPERGCSVYESRPLQCRAFPFWSSVVNSRENWEMTAKDCPGVNRGTLHSRDSIEKWLALRQKEPIISRIISGI